MVIIHTTPPEPFVFLSVAAEALREYKEQHGHFAKTWVELGMSYAAMPYHIGDPGVFPRESEARDWKPKGSDYTYRLTVAPDGSEFRIDAMGPQCQIDYYIDQDHGEPVKVTQ